MAVNAKALGRVIATGDKILLDTNVLIAYLQGGQAASDAATLIMDRWVTTGRNRAVIGMVSAMELLVGPMRAGRSPSDTVDLLRRFPNLTCEPLTFDAAFAAASLRAKFSALKAPDALIIGTAVVTNAGAIVTSDAAWSKLSPVPVILLSDYFT